MLITGVTSGVTAAISTINDTTCENLLPGQTLCTKVPTIMSVVVVVSLRKKCTITSRLTAPVNVYVIVVVVNISALLSIIGPCLKSLVTGLQTNRFNVKFRTQASRATRASFVGMLNRVETIGSVGRHTLTDSGTNTVSRLRTKITVNDERRWAAIMGLRKLRKSQMMSVTLLLANG